MSLSIKNYMRNLIAGIPVISGLYDAVIDARRICSKGGIFNFTFSLNGFGTKRYSARDLINLDDEALCKSVRTIINEVENMMPTLDQMVLLLLKGRTEIRGLYSSYFRAQNAISDAKILCYTFNNPYGIYANIDKNNIRLDSKQILNLFKTSGTNFNSMIIITII